MNLGDVKSRVKRQFGDESAVQVTDDDITRWVNDAQYHIVMNNEGLLEKVATIDIVANVQDYPLPSGLLTLRSINILTAGETSYIHMQGYDLQKFDAYVDGWDGSKYGPGLPFVYTVYAGSIKLFPAPDSNSTAGLKVYYNGEPTAIVNDNDVLGLGRLYDNAIVNYCLAQAYEMDENLYLAFQKTSQVQDDITKNRSNMGQNKETYQIITVSPDDAW
jgi:hypothetical protein